MRACIQLFLALFLAGCGGQKAFFPPVMAPAAGVGSIMTPWSRPQKLTWDCAAKIGIVPSFVEGSGGATEFADTSAKLSAAITNWASGKAEYKNVKKITLSLRDGRIESLPLEDIFVKYDDLSGKCKDAIAGQKGIGAKYFVIATKIYRGTIDANVELSRGVTVQGKADVLAKLGSDLSGSVESTSNSTASLKVDGGVWIIESEPYRVP